MATNIAATKLGKEGGDKFRSVKRVIAEPKRKISSGKRPGLRKEKLSVEEGEKSRAVKIQFKVKKLLERERRRGGKRGSNKNKITVIVDKKPESFRRRRSIKNGKRRSPGDRRRNRKKSPKFNRKLRRNRDRIVAG